MTAPKSPGGERRTLLAGNWKMNHLRDDALRFADHLREVIDRWQDVDVALFPPATLLSPLQRALAGTRVRLGGQNCHHEREGAFTGEVSAAMLADAGCAFVLVGHSERRALFGETDETCGKKLRAALDAGLRPVLCLGETQSERDAGRTEEVLERQLRAGLLGLGADLGREVALAYEPVWAIGTGRTATPDVAQAAHAFLRGRLAAILGQAAADAMLVLYGGSMKSDNVEALIDQPDVDGGLVGGASLDPETFAALLRGASRLRPRST